MAANIEQEIVSLSRDKWRWMSERQLEPLAALFHDQAVFVHMGATMTKDEAAPGGWPRSRSPDYSPRSNTKCGRTLGAPQVVIAVCSHDRCR